MIQNEDNEDASEMLGHLSRYFQYITRDDAITVTLEKEISHMSEYVGIQLIRFKGRVIFEQEELPIQYTMLETPQLILQPIVETYFKYSNLSANQPQKLRVSYEANSQCLSVCFADNLNHIEEHALEALNAALAGDRDTDEVTGLINISRRLQYMQTIVLKQNMTSRNITGLLCK